MTEATNGPATDEGPCFVVRVEEDENAAPFHHGPFDSSREAFEELERLRKDDPGNRYVVATPEVRD